VNECILLAVLVDASVTGDIISGTGGREQSVISLSGGFVLPSEVVVKLKLFSNDCDTAGSWWTELVGLAICN